MRRIDWWNVAETVGMYVLIIAAISAVILFLALVPR